jgi:hypothetical protein
MSKLFLAKFAVFYFQFLVIKPWIRIGIQPKMLDPDPDQMNTDPKQWNALSIAPPFVFAIESVVKRTGTSPGGREEGV